MSMTLNVPQRRVIKKVEFCDDDTHMMHFLKTLLQRRLMRKWCDKNALDEIMCSQLYNYAMGSISGQRTFCYAPINIVFSARLSVQSAMWYVPYNEPLPAPIAFHPVHEVADLSTYPTVSRLLLMEQRVPREERGRAGMYKTKFRMGLDAIAKDVGISYSSVTAIFSRVKVEGSFSFFPSVKVMYALSKYIPIDTWFVFPDELDDEGIKGMFNKWPPEWGCLDKGRG